MWRAPAGQSADAQDISISSTGRGSLGSSSTFGSDTRWNMCPDMADFKRSKEDLKWAIDNRDELQDKYKGHVILVRDKKVVASAVDIKYISHSCGCVCFDDVSMIPFEAYDKTKLDASVKWAKDNEKTLSEQYPDQYVLVEGDSVVDTADTFATSLKKQKKYPNSHILGFKPI